MTSGTNADASFTVVNLGISEVPMMWQINEQGLPGTGQVNQKEMENLLELSELSLGVFEDKKLIFPFVSFFLN